MCKQQQQVTALISGSMVSYTGVCVSAQRINRSVEVVTWVSPVSKGQARQVRELAKRGTYDTKQVDSAGYIPRGLSTGMQTGRCARGCLANSVLEGPIMQPTPSHNTHAHNIVTSHPAGRPRAYQRNASH
jgi:hypothetical protein